MKKLVLETTAPFQGLPELVAYDEGLFEKEGLQIEWADREKGVEKKTDTSITTQKGENPFSSHGRLLEQGQADMYNACEWGNYCRVQDTGVGSRQLGRRGIVTYAAIVVRPDSAVYTAQQLAGKTVGVPFYFGTHYLALHLLEGIPAARVDQGGQGAERLALSLRLHDAGRVEATTLTEPLHHARPRRRAAARSARPSITVPKWHPTKVDASTYGSFNRAVREAVKRINANKKAYLHYFIDYHKAKDPEIGTLKPGRHPREPHRGLRSGARFRSRKCSAPTSG
jgi:NitT/TauT family transport system substrate-binding protein